jgi:hypothetical protein
MSDEIAQLIEEARILKNRDIMETEKKYLEAVDKLEMKKGESKSSRAEFLTTKAEYLWFRSSFLLENESLQDSRNRMLEALRLIYQTTKLDTEYKKHFEQKIKEMIISIILNIGCIIPEDETHVHINCPIKIRNMGTGEFGFSIGMFVKKLECSICGHDILSDECSHEPGNEYNGKKCISVAKEIVLDHFSITKNPKDPNSRFTSLSIPKKEFYEDFPPEEIKGKIENNLPLICSLCRETKINPNEIDIDLFFKMQGLEL